MPEPVRCVECGSITAPMFRDNRGTILCRSCIRDEHPDFEWPPTGNS